MVLIKNIAYDFDTQPFRLLAKARSHLPFQGAYKVRKKRMLKLLYTIYLP